MINPMYYAAHAQAMMVVRPVILKVLGTTYVLDGDVRIHYDPIEDAKLGKRPLVGGRFNEPFERVLDAATGKQVGELEFRVVGETWVKSFSPAFDGVERNLEDALSRLGSIDYVNDECDIQETFGIGYLHFQTTEDIHRGVLELTSRRSRPPVVTERAVRDPPQASRQYRCGSIQFIEPNILRFEHADVTPRVRQYRGGKYIIEVDKDERPVSPFDIALPEDFQLSHASLYYVEPLSVPSLVRLMKMELNAFGEKRELGSTSRTWDILLTEHDLEEIAPRLTVLPYWARGHIFGVIESLLRDATSSIVTRNVLERAVDVVYAPYLAAAHHLGLPNLSPDICHQICGQRYENKGVGALMDDAERRALRAVSEK